ncbi:zinc-binding dehydrogenase [Yersinia enterocolitica]
MSTHSIHGIYDTEKSLAGGCALAAKLNEMFPLIRDGIASPRIAGIFPLNELATALSVMSQNASQGKILIRCDS